MIERLTEKINSFSKKIGKINYILLLIVLSSLIIMGLYQTFSLLTESQGVSYSNGTKTYKFIIGNNEENNISIAENDNKYIDISILNDKEIDLSYSLYYKTDSKQEDLIIGFLNESSSKPEGKITKGEKKVISLKVINNTNSQVNLKIGVNSGTIDGGELKKSGTRITEEISNLDELRVNEPELSNNLIPVYYNIETHKWHKADESNMNIEHKWYNYSSKEKMWANAIIVTEQTKNNYLNIKPGSIINDQDIIAFFVWIPRYKYHIWNLKDEIPNQNEYIYDAINNGIDIKFEQGLNTTGNITCNYNKRTICKKNNTEVNDNDLWYTHPAFTYGEKELTGFWIGKYKTSGTNEEPRILPNNIAIRNIDISEEFTISKKMSDYIINSNLDAHLMKNTEWGGVAYLVHSIYGICNEKCVKVKTNNSKLGITGRSSGKENLDEINDNGNYTYDGYTITENNITNDNDISKISSTTNNIYGIYDLSGYISEYVMGNMVTSKNTFNNEKSNNKWNKAQNLSNRYYDKYSYGITNKDNAALNRSILGDATKEVTIIENNIITNWNNEKELAFVSENNAWFLRGESSIFNYKSTNGEKNIKYGFRISLS